MSKETDFLVRFTFSFVLNLTNIELNDLKLENEEDLKNISSLLISGISLALKLSKRSEINKTKFNIKNNNKRLTINGILNVRDKNELKLIKKQFNLLIPNRILSINIQNELNLDERNFHIFFLSIFNLLIILLGCV